MVSFNSIKMGVSGRGFMNERGVLGV